MLTLSAIQSFFHADYSGTQQLLKQILEPIFGNYQSGYDEITKSQTIKEKAKAANIKSIKHAATFWAEGLDIKLFDVTLEDKCHIHVARKNIQQLVREYVDRFEGAFIVFHYEQPEGRSWRLSYLEKRQNNAASTNAKRYTYLCGKDYPCRTIAERFYALQSQDLNAINLEKAFSVEALSDEFFTEYAAQYNNICKYIYENRTDTTRFGEAFADCEDKFIRDYVKKMMGRITFLHFLQKKGWMGVPKNAEWGQGDVNFMYHLFEYANGEQKEDFLDLVLEPIFFNCLNKPRENDLFDTNVTKIGEVRIPYLNGGLFEKDEIDKPQSTLPKEIFKNLLDFYARFNFTIDENDPLDAEVGVDPEMLGKIFENLLEDNKDKGAFYTPKEIVNYMCKESLIAYLVTEAQQACEVNKQRQENFEAAIRALVEDPEMTVSRIKRYDERQLEVLSRALMEVKICDPAIGSGAFPMGLLNLLFKCRTAVNNALGQNVPPAELKKDIIRNNIYGVDIEKGAIDIARLRFWLSIVVDLEEPEALPNFDYKFMQGNSLLEQFAGVDLSDMFASKATEGKGSGVQLISFDEVSTTQTILHERLRHYFGMCTGEDKHQLREKVNQAVADLICAKVNEAPELVSQIRDIDVSANDKFFLWHTWFADVFNRPSKQGFDIVIGNPPFISIQGMTPWMKKTYKQAYKFFYHRYDMFACFIELGMNILCKEGVLTFIQPSVFLNSKSFMYCREHIVKNCTISLLNLLKDGVFSSAVVPTMIMQIQNVKATNTHKITCTQEGLDKPYKIKQAAFYTTEGNVFNMNLDEVTYSLIEKTSKNCVLLGDIAQVANGINTGDLSSYLLERPEGDCFPIMKGASIGKWIYEYKNLYLKNEINSFVSCGDLHSLKPTEKLMMKRIGITPSVAYDCTGIACLHTVHTIRVYDSKFSTKYVMGLINSFLIGKIFRMRVPLKGDVFPEFRVFDLNLQIPIKDVSKSNQQQIVDIVDEILRLKGNDANADVTILEKELDKLVYQLYELTPDEIAMIEQA